MDDIKRLAILGSTGSIGRQTLEVVRAFPHKLKVVGLGAGENESLLLKQAEEFKPKFISLSTGSIATSLHYQVLTPEEIATSPGVDLVVVATSGKAGLGPTLSAIRARKKVALANKEVLVMAGEIVSAEARRYSVELLPIDSEHSALWQCLQGEENEVKRLILTASGGPFRNLSLQELARVTPEEALQHPTWRMGKKVTIDSATLMNKGMEIIEAHWLFATPLEKIQVVVHPQSIIHSMVEFVDGSVKAQLSYPDMRLPIQYALSYPERWKNPTLPRLELDNLRSLTFDAPDIAKFPCLRLAREAGEKGGTCPAVLCAADEVAVELFLSHRLGFLEIPRVVERTLEQHRCKPHPALEEILEADAWAREKARELALRGVSC